MEINTNLKAQPVLQKDRIFAIDTLRGVALLGILLMNIPGFAMPERFYDAFHNNTSDPSYWTDAVITILFEGKMRALFSMIFGAGILLFILRKKQNGLPYKVLFLRRMGWLIIFGLIHAHLLLWIGDILYLYGVIGLLAFLFRNMKPKYLAMGVPVVAIVSFAMSVMFYHSLREKRMEFLKAEAMQKKHQPLTAAQKKAIAEWKEAQKEFIPNNAQIASHTKSMKSDYGTVAKYIRPLAWDGQTKYLVYSVGDVLALMMLGMALYKWRFFTGEWSGGTYKRTALIGYGIGLPLVIYNFYAYSQIAPGPEASIRFLETHPINWRGIIYPFQRILLVMAHASVIMLILRAGIWKKLTSSVAAVGQMAFTNYIMHTIFCTLFFFGYGLNYFAELEYYQLYYVVVVIWAIQLIISPIWLKHFLFGPLEWLWRSLTYWHIQPFKRKI